MVWWVVLEKQHFVMYICHPTVNWPQCWWMTIVPIITVFRPGRPKPSPEWRCARPGKFWRKRGMLCLLYPYQLYLNKGEKCFFLVKNSTPFVSFLFYFLGCTVYRTYFFSCLSILTLGILTPPLSVLVHFFVCLFKAYFIAFLNTSFGLLQVRVSLKWTFSSVSGCTTALNSKNWFTTVC